VYVLLHVTKPAAHRARRINMAPTLDARMFS